MITARSRRVLLLLLLLVAAAAPLACLPADDAPSSARFVVTYPEGLTDGPLDGRLYLMLSARDYDGTEATEPRFLVANWRGGEPLFAIDVDGWMPGEEAVFDAGALGFPVDSLADMPAGDYHLQAMLHVYTTFERADGHTVKLPMDQWEGQNWRISPGNFYSDVSALNTGLDPADSGTTVSLELTNEIPPRPAAARGHRVHQVPEVPQRHPERLVGHRHAPRGDRPGAAGLGARLGHQVPGGLLPGSLPRLLLHAGHVPRGTADGRPRGLRPHVRGVQPPALPGLVVGQAAEVHRRDDAAPDAVLRRLVRGELGEQRPLRRRPHAGTHPDGGGGVSAASARAGRARCTADRPAAGSHSPGRFSTRTCSTAPG